MSCHITTIYMAVWNRPYVKRVKKKKKTILSVLYFLMRILRVNKVWQGNGHRSQMRIISIRKRTPLLHVAIWDFVDKGISCALCPLWFYKSRINIKIRAVEGRLRCTVSCSYNPIFLMESVWSLSSRDVFCGKNEFRAPNHTEVSLFCLSYILWLCLQLLAGRWYFSGQISN